MTAVRLKICGVRSAGEARQLRAAGVDYAGLNFIPHSTRYISLETAQAIMDEFKGSGIQTVGLFQSCPSDKVNDYAAQLGLDYVQLHGEEPADYARQLKTPVMRAVPVQPDSSADAIIALIDSYPADYFVIDRAVQGRGEPVDLAVAKQIISARHGRIFLAGGLTPDNLADILAHVHPFGIDIAGGVRIDNHLDTNKVQQCLEAIRTARTN